MANASADSFTSSADSCEQPSEHQLHLHGVNCAVIDIEAVKGVRPELKALHRVPGLVLLRMSRSQWEIGIAASMVS